jgi:hypothetical protein
MARSPASSQATWDGLNDRQRTYLRVIFAHDQVAEQAERSRGPYLPTRPAEEWRWLLYGVKKPLVVRDRSAMQRELEEAGMLDQGAGSTLAVLRRRGLVLVKETREVMLGLLVPVLWVRLTTRGRAAARAGLEVATPPRIPRGLLTRGLWGALSRFYPVGDDGLVDWVEVYDLDGSLIPRERHAPSWNTLLWLDRREEPLIEDFKKVDRTRPGNDHHGPTTSRSQTCYRLTAAGRRHYQRHWACYAELYPDIDAPRPTSPPDGAHQGLVDHKPPRVPKGLLREPLWRVLAMTVRVQQQGWPGLARYQVDKQARSKSAWERLAGWPGGALVEEFQAPRPPWQRQEWDTGVFIWVRLTPAGEAHYRQHHATYQTLWPDVDAPELRPRVPEESRGPL